MGNVISTTGSILPSRLTLDHKLNIDDRIFFKGARELAVYDIYKVDSIQSLRRKINLETGDKIITIENDNLESANEAKSTNLMQVVTLLLDTEDLKKGLTHTDIFKTGFSILSNKIEKLQAIQKEYLKEINAAFSIDRKTIRLTKLYIINLEYSIDKIFIENEKLTKEIQEYITQENTVS